MDNFGVLKWTIEERSREVNFLDLTIKINGCNQIETRTYQKPMNLYLYLHNASAHPPGVMKGVMFGEVKRYKMQNTRRTDFLKMLRLLFIRMRARGHDPAFLKKCIIEACDKLDEPPPQQEETMDRRDKLFLHLQYRPHGISRHALRDAFNNTCDNFVGTEAEIKQVSVAFSRPPNLKDRLTSARLREATPTAAQCHPL